MDNVIDLPPRTHTLSLAHTHSLSLSRTQGRLGNCYYLAAMAGCALGDNDILIKDLCIEDFGNVGLYAGRHIYVYMHEHLYVYMYF